MDVPKQHDRPVTETKKDLSSVARSRPVRHLSDLTLPEIKEAVTLVSRIVPAGDIPGTILSGLARLPGRRLSRETARQDTNRLFAALEKLYDATVYNAAFTGPAAIIWAYQSLLKLAGKDPTSAFPEGTWQFYLNYALREDTARHTSETRGFDAILHKHDISLSPADRLAAWVMAAIHCLHQYDELLKNEWRERVYTQALAELTAGRPDAAQYARLYRDWEQQRPYGRGRDARAQDTYPSYRRRKFNRFLERAMRHLPEDLRRAWVERVRVTREEDLPAYQKQMSILAYLNPGRYEETRVPIPLEWAHVGVIHQGHYTLIPACAPDSRQPAEPETVRAQIAALVNDAGNDGPSAATSLMPLARVQRAALAEIHEELNDAVREEWDVLRLAPILINNDPRPSHLPLCELRQGERGVGNQALTIFDTRETVVFDQSHIFFDGTWGAALAEILTNEALSWAAYLSSLPPSAPAGTPPAALSFPLAAEEQRIIAQAPTVMDEVGAENDAGNIKAILALRRLFKLRNDLIHLTVNDILILYRAVHAATYRPDGDLVATLEELAAADHAGDAAQLALDAIAADNAINPAVLIPVDASRRAPRERVHPMSFTVPLEELDLLELHRRTVAALDAYRQGKGDRDAAYAEFDRLQRRYLATLAGCGAVFSRAKAVAGRGESTPVGTIKMLAHLPPALQQWLDTIPGRFEVLNDIIKGREVFSNIGAVARSSSLTRFMTAKDDNEHKTLAWGVLTTADDVMHITLRDFRPHVPALITAGHRDLATRIVQDYLDAYVQGLNDFIAELRRITTASRETQSITKEGEKWKVTSGA